MYLMKIVFTLRKLCYFKKNYFDMQKCIVVMMLLLKGSILIVANQIINNETTEVPVNYTLDMRVIPIHYDIEIKPYFNEADVPKDKYFTFDGETHITIQAKEDNITQITLHAKNLNITKTELRSVKVTNILFKYTLKVKAITSKADNVTDHIIVSWAKPLMKMKVYQLIFHYSGLIYINEDGICMNYIQKENMEIQWFAATHLQPVGARRVFPCFDEPQYKTTFVIRINHSKKYKSWSNMKISHTVPIYGTNRVTDVYKTTPPMSTYLVAFLIADMEERTSSTGNISVISFRKLYCETKYALDSATKLLKKFDEYTDIPYNSMDKVEKLDLVALPIARIAGMENWGLVTLRSVYITYNEENSLTDKKSNINLLSHELAHMWFGNLVTCEHWRFLWLNEGFASYFSYFMTVEVSNEFEFEKHFMIEPVHRSFEVDANNKKVALTQKVLRSETDIRNNFSVITYWKGATIIRTISHIIGEDNFKRAIRSFLKRNQYKSVTPDKLFEVLAENWNNKEVDLKEILIDLTEQPGYPVVTISRNKDGMSFYVSQHPCCEHTNLENDDTERQWTVPISYTTNSENNFNSTTPRIFLKKNSKQKIELDHKADWIIANIQRTGYYRVNYDTDTWYNIIEALKSKNFGGIHEMNRAQLLDDAISLALIGQLDIKITLVLLEYLENELAHTPWFSAQKLLTEGFNLLPKQYHRSYEMYVRKLLKNIFPKLKFEQIFVNESYLDHMSRPIIQNLACKAAHPECITKGKEYLDDLIANDGTISHKRYIFYCSAFQKYGVKYFNYLYNQCLQTNGICFEENYIMTCTNNRHLIWRYLDLILIEKSISFRITDFLKIMKTPGNQEAVFDYINANYDTVFKSVASINGTVWFFKDIQQYIITEEQLQQLMVIYNGQRKNIDDSEKTNLEKSFWELDESIWKNAKITTRWSEYLESAELSTGNITSDILILRIICISICITVARLNIL